MPPQLQALLQNRNALIGIGVALLTILILLILQPWSSKGPPKGGGTLAADQLSLASVDNVGKALEIQALLARDGIDLDRRAGDGGKTELLFEKEATKDDRDRAIIALVQSGLMDRNVGLEAFDKGDLTASRDEKKIKLVRSQQGELARLIRKITPIQDATVSLSIPEPTIFKSDQKPMSASVQVTLNNNERLTRDKVRSIINLVVGGIQGLDAQHVSLTDTNGNTYNSVLDLGAEMTEKLEEEDSYMKQKVASQLDKLVGNGHYVVTVSTLLREVTKETMTQNYDPDGTVVSNKQTFSENLNSPGPSNGRASGTAGGPVTAVVPNGLTSWMASGPPYAYPPPQQGYPEPPRTIRVPRTMVPYLKTPVPVGKRSTQQSYHNHLQSSAYVTPWEGGLTGTVPGKGYNRSGADVAYATGKTQVLETAMPGVLEDISIAVSIDQDSMPSMDPAELQRLIANAASPKVRPGNVSIVVTHFSHPELMGSKDKPGQSQNGSSTDMSNEAPDLPPEDKKATAFPVQWLIWGGSTVLLLGIAGLVLFFSQTSGQEKQKMKEAQRDLEQLREMAMQQQIQIQAAQAQAQVLMQAHQTQQQASEQRAQASNSMKDTLKELQAAISQQEPGTLSHQLQQWLAAGE